MEITLNIKNTENVRSLSEQQLKQVTEILEALVSSGGLTGVKGGQTIIHFDHMGTFKSVQLSYYPFVRRSLDG